MSKLSDYSKFDHLVDSDDEGDAGGDQNNQIIHPQHSTPPPPQFQTSAVVAGEQEQQEEEEEEEWLFCRHPQHSTRFILKHGPTGRSIYEWEQSLQDVTIYIPTPPNVITNANQLVCHIFPNRLQVGRRQQQQQQQQLQSSTAATTSAAMDNHPQYHYFLNESTFGTVDVANSTWTWDDETNVMTIELQKANKGVVWEAAVCVGSTSTNGNGAAPPQQQPQQQQQQQQSPDVRLNPIFLEQEKQRLMLERWQEEHPGMDFSNATFNGSVPDPRSFMGGVRYE
ncbi:hypothetical protein ACA910_015685 [Epithemia clementina (nom. ined.)]